MVALQAREVLAVRLWSLHPAHLDGKGLVACWREALLAQAVLDGRTRGYRSHPQLVRFRALDDPLSAIGAYLTGLAAEATARGYRFDRDRIVQPARHRDGGDDLGGVPLMSVTDGQLAFEWSHLGRKLAGRSPEDAERWRASDPAPHPLFDVVPGRIEDWERP